MKKSLVLVLILVVAVGSIFGQKISIDFWHHESPTHRVAAFQKVIDDFQKVNPNITVTQHVVPWGDSVTKAMAALAAGNPPDFIFSYPQIGRAHV